MKKTARGFTLIELMIVVAIIGILAAVAVPKFADLISKSKEGATKGALSTVRSALHVYYGDNEGLFPYDNLDILTLNMRYLNQMPAARLPQTGHLDSTGVVTLSSYTAAGEFDTTTDAGGTAEQPAGTGGGGWAYFNSALVSSAWGTFVANCVHEDMKGQADAGHFLPWTSF